MDDEQSAGAPRGEVEGNRHDPRADDPAMPAPEDDVVEGHAFEEFCTEVDRAFPEDELSIEELVALPAGDGHSADAPADAASSPEDADETSSDDAPGTIGDGGSAIAADAAETAVRAEPSEGPGATGDAESSGETSGHAVGAEQGEREGVDAAERFVDAIATRELSDEERERVRRALGVDAPTSTEVRIRHLQSNLADLEAYVDAIEAFIDDRGTAREILDELETQVDDLSAALKSLAATVDDHGDRFEERAEAIEELRTGIADHHQRIENTDSRVANAEDRVDDLETALATIENRLEAVASIDDRVAEIETTQRRVAQAFTADDVASGGDAPDDPDPQPAGTD